MNQPVTSRPALVIAALLLIGALRVAASIMAPITLAAVLAVVMYPTYAGLRRRKVPSYAALIAILVAIAGLAATLTVLMALALSDVRRLLPSQLQTLSLRLDHFNVWVEQRGIGVIPHISIESVLPVAKLNVILPSAVGVVVGMAGTAFVVLLLMTLFLPYADRGAAWVRYHMGPQPERNIEDLLRNVRGYVWIKTVISALTGMGAWAITGVFGSQYSILWGFATFILNFIPNFGSVISTALILAAASLSAPFIEVLAQGASLVILHIALGVVTEPVWMGRRAKMPAAIVVLSLLFWGWMWGALGMLVAVPLTLLTREVLRNSPWWRASSLMDVADANTN